MVLSSVNRHVNIRQTIANLERLADNPGTEAEGQSARAAAIRIATKHGIPCKFLQPRQKSAEPRPFVQASPRAETRPFTQAPPPRAPRRSIPHAVLEFERVLVRDGWKRMSGINYDYASKLYPHQLMQIGMCNRAWVCRHQRETKGDHATLFQARSPRELTEYLHSQTCKIERVCPW